MNDCNEKKVTIEIGGRSVSRELLPGQRIVIDLNEEGIPKAYLVTLESQVDIDDFIFDQ